MIRMEACEKYSEESDFGFEEMARVWPSINILGLDEPTKRWRMLGIGGSDANTIFSGNAERLLRLWREKRGETPSEDLSGKLAVQLGCWTEDFNRQWYERLTGFLVSNVGLRAVSQDHEWRRATLDGMVEARSSIWEAKHTSAFAKPEEVLSRYMPQLQHNMAVLGLENATLSVIYGNHKWECYEIAYDWLYQDELLWAEQRFWECVKSGSEPVPVAPPVPPRPDACREISFNGNNTWAVAADDWLVHSDAAKIHTAAVVAIKQLIEPDVVRAYGYGIEARRSKAGAISIRKLAE